MPESLMNQIGLMAAIALPLFNIPLIVRMIKRKSSEDMSLLWALGVWVCILLMLPSGLNSQDVVWRTFNLINAVLFTAVVIVMLKYRRWGKYGGK